MTNQDILDKAQALARDNGWDGDTKGFDALVGHYALAPNPWPVESKAKLFIFNHDFAKALWGEKDHWETTDCTCGGVDFHMGGFDSHKPECAKVSSDRGYKYHLKEMVVAEDPIKYLGEHLDD